MKIIGHRGAKGLAPENTLAGLKKALQHNVDGIEIDIRVTSDNVAILLHDDHVTDPTGSRLSAHDHTYSELKRHKPDLTTLDQAIAQVARQVPLIIEVKETAALEATITTVREFIQKGWQPADLPFISFKYRILEELHAAFPDHELIVDDMWSGVRATWRARRLGSRQISLYRPILWSGFIRAVSSHGYQLYCFPQNDPKQTARWKKAGLYGVITDYPDLFE